MANSAEQQLLSGQTWAEFCEVLKRSGGQILRPEAPADALTRAEGFRYLSRLLRIALEMHVEFADPAFPGFFSPSHETAKIGADNPDNLYRYARLDGHAEYRIRGRRGTVAYLSFGTQKGGYETDGRMVQTGFLDSNKLAVEADGSFEIVLSARQHAGNWVCMEPGTNALVVRQTFLDRKSETAAELHIERLDGSDKPPVLDAERLHGGLLRAAGFVEGTARIFADWARGYGGHVNALPPADQAVCQAAGGDPNIFYYHSCWALADDEALVVEVDRVPACDFWNFQINNYWMESLDYRYHDICVNKHSARLDGNGGVTIVLSARDAGQPNWLETAGHHHGTMCWRWVGAAQPVHPRTRVVKLESLRNEVRENT
jgi:hypothetical protein